MLKTIEITRVQMYLGYFKSNVYLQCAKWLSFNVFEYFSDITSNPRLTIISLDDHLVHRDDGQSGKVTIAARNLLLKALKVDEYRLI